MTKDAAAPEVTEWLSGVLSDLRTQFKERVANPFVFAFIASWNVLNFKFWLVVFGEGTYQAKISYLNRLHPPDEANWRYYFLPLVVAVLYPIIEIGLAIASRFIQNQRSKFVLKIEERQTIPLDQQLSLISSLKADLSLQQARITTAKSAYNEQVNKLIGAANWMSREASWYASQYYLCMHKLTPPLIGRQHNRANHDKADLSTLGWDAKYAVCGPTMHLVRKILQEVAPLQNERFTVDQISSLVDVAEAEAIPEAVMTMVGLGISNMQLTDGVITLSIEKCHVNAVELMKQLPD